MDKPQAKQLFGNPLRVALAGWILAREGASFFQLEAQDALRGLGYTSSSVPGELQVFVANAMLTQADIKPRKYLTPVESPLWAAFEAILVALAELDLESSEVESGEPPALTETAD